MPVYEYECPKCKDIKEIITIRSEDKKVICDKCDLEMKKIISGSSFILKGIGWGADGYENKK